MLDFLHFKSLQVKFLFVNLLRKAESTANLQRTFIKRTWKVASVASKSIKLELLHRIPASPETAPEQRATKYKH